jgi:Predicted divalent heavy-metal cations transporter
MNVYILVTISTLLTFGATIIGASLVFFLNNFNSKMEKICLGLASGIMISASIFSLMIPALEINNCITVIISLMIGSLIIIFIKKIVTQNKKKSSFFIAVTLHNIPEGMAVGLACALAFKDNSMVSVTSALMLAIGVAVQNIPEGAAISLPLVKTVGSKKEAFKYGVLSGIIEPISGIVMVFLVAYLEPFMGICLSIAAGTMFYVVVDELIPESKNNSSDIGAISFMIGFCIMMFLDIILG